MKTLEILTKAPKAGEGVEATTNFETGETVAECVEMFGEEAVLGYFERQLSVNIQAGVRKCLENSADPNTWIAAFKPGTRGPSIAKDPKLAARSAISQMTDEEKAALMADLQAALG